MVSGAATAQLPIELARGAIAATPDLRSGARIEIHAGASALADVRADWTFLEQHGGAATPFQSYGVAIACAAAHMQRQAMPRIVVLRRDGQPKVIIPTVVTQLCGFPVIRFLGDPLIQYGDILSAADVDRAEMLTSLSAAADSKIACLALFRRVREDARVVIALSSLAREMAVEESPLVDLTRPPVVTGRDLREDRRKRRNLAERGQLRVEVVRGEAAQPWLAKALKLKRRWIEEQGFQSAVIGCPEWEQAMHDILGADGSELAAAVLTCGGQPAAIEIAFVNTTSWLGFLGAYEPSFATYSPGAILGGECLRWARQKGLSIFDQLPPSQRYKRRYATGAVKVRDFAMPLTRMGELPLALSRMIPSFKWILGELPQDIRLTLLKLSG